MVSARATAAPGTSAYRQGARGRRLFPGTFAFTALVRRVGCFGRGRAPTVVGGVVFVGELGEGHGDLVYRVELGIVQLGALQAGPEVVDHEAEFF